MMTEPSVIVVLVDKEQRRMQMKVVDEMIDGQHWRAESVLKPLMRLPHIMRQLQHCLLSMERKMQHHRWLQH